jgi:hypothetical protein
LDEGFVPHPANNNAAITNTQNFILYLHDSGFRIPDCI